jgi:hypothetical protein
MAKQRITDDQQKRFSKQQFKIGEAVFFSWLGQKKYGYVIRIKEANWGIMYTVESENTRYPCGIEIKGQKTSYNTGYIYYEATRSIDSTELSRRADTGYDRGNPEVLINERRTEVQSGSDTSTSKSVSKPTSKSNEPTKTRTPRKNVAKPSTNGVRKTNPRQRVNTELDSAIQKQKDFLNGFIKKD